MDCGPTCLRMVAKYHGRHYTINSLRKAAGFGKGGVSLLGISEAAENIGFRTKGVQLAFEELAKNARLPCILHWRQNHFVVLMPFSKWKSKKWVHIADPSKGVITYTKQEFLQHWASHRSDEGEQVGNALLLETTPRFYEEEGEKLRRLNWSLVLRYMRQSRWQITQVFIALLIASVLQLIFPFLTQSIVDTGINSQDLQYITIVLMAQLMLVFSRTIVDFIRGRLLLHISTIVNLSILSDFWIKLINLPVSYFDSRHTGDTLQRVNDHKQIQSFLTGNALSTIFSLFNFVLFAGVLGIYNGQIFLVFIIGSVLYFSWIRLFLNIRRKINYKTFHVSASENNATLQMIQGMQEIKLHNAGRLKRWEWEDIQATIFRLNFKTLTYSQIQQVFGLLISQGKDIVITFLAASLVIKGQLTLGAMLAIQYIIGQLNGPIEQFVAFVQSAQDARISMERLNEVHQLEDEEPPGKGYVKQLPENRSICFKDFSFTYSGAGNQPVLKDFQLEIPQGKVTAIVGASGSGKTTLLKLLLKFYDFYTGELKIGDSDFKNISPSFWRSQCGAVLQDSYIFSDSIARNIAVGEEVPEYERLIDCCRTANILSFIESLPNGFNTLLGAEGVGVSQGQRQRILIARAIYKNPEYLFFDEATNALDANNEKAIVENLQWVFKGRTVLIVAHRLSTVRNADKIIVLKEGVIVEEGTHQELASTKGVYYELVKNQLELGN